MHVMISPDVTGFSFSIADELFAEHRKRLAFQANADRVPAPDETKQAVLSAIRLPEQANCLFA